MLTISLSIGVVVSVILVSLTGLSAGGFVTSGYLALVLDRPTILLTFTLITLVTWALVWALARFTFLYGPRVFAFALLISMLLSTGVELVRPTFGPIGFDIRSVGYIVPGLVAFQITRQGFLPTALSIAVAAPLVRGLTLLALTVPGWIGL